MYNRIVGSLMRFFIFIACVALLAPVCRAGNGLVEPTNADHQEKQDSEDNDESFHWRDAAEQSFLLLSMQHAVRLTQDKTQKELVGPFWSDYVRSVESLGGWRDGDSLFTNYFAHPAQGSVSGYIFLQNSPASQGTYFSADSRYWSSRLKAMAFAAVYSAQFELGPYSEASIGNVGLRPRTMGYVDLVMTPIGGLGWMLAEDAVDRYIVQPLESRTNRPMVRFLRMALGPTRSFANILRFKKPWRRDDRDYAGSASGPSLPSSTTTPASFGGTLPNKQDD